MSKIEWKPGNMLYPIPAVMVTTRNKEGKDNVFTVAWTGTISSDPVMVSISVRPSRFSYTSIEETGEFVINLTTEELAQATDYCGVRSGRDEDKFKKMNLTKEEATHVNVPMIKESPVNLECKVVEKRDLGVHHMYMAEVVAVHVDDQYMDENQKFDLAAAKPLVYCHGEYYGMGDYIGKFGYSVKKK